MDYHALERLVRLRDSGALTEEEFNQQKANVLSSPAASPRREHNRLAIFAVALAGAVAVTAGWFAIGRQAEEPDRPAVSKPAAAPPVRAKKETSPAPNAATGIIAGKLSYPSDYLPDDLVACAVHVGTKAKTCSSKRTERADGTFYEMRLPVGDYTVHATTKDDLSYKAYFSEAVPCGLSVECTSHKPIVVRVTADSVASGVDPGDWYAR